MSSSDAWSQRRAEGFALAATAHADLGATAALPGLAAGIAAQARAVAVRIGQLERGARRAWLQELLVRQPPPHADQRGRSPRALALLANSVEKSVGRAWLACAPMPRAGFRVDPRLLALLRALAGSPARGSDQPGPNP